MTDRGPQQPFGKPLYQIGRDRPAVDLLGGLMVGVLAGTYATFKVNLVVGLIAGFGVAALLLVLMFARRGRRARGGESGGGDGGGGDAVFDPTTTRHFDACHSDGSGDGGDGGDGGGDGGGGD